MISSLIHSLHLLPLPPFFLSLGMKVEGRPWMVGLRDRALEVVKTSLLLQIFSHSLYPSSPSPSLSPFPQHESGREGGRGWLVFGVQFLKMWRPFYSRSSLVQLLQLSLSLLLPLPSEHKDEGQGREGVGG